MIETANHSQNHYQYSAPIVTGPHWTFEAELLPEHYKIAESYYRSCPAITPWAALPPEIKDKLALHASCWLDAITEARLT